MASRSTKRILRRNRPLVNKTPTNFVDFKEISLGEDTTEGKQESRYLKRSLSGGMRRSVPVPEPRV